MYCMYLGAVIVVEVIVIVVWIKVVIVLENKVEDVKLLVGIIE